MNSEQIAVWSAADKAPRQVFLGNFNRMLNRVSIETRPSEVSRFLRGQREFMGPQAPADLSDLRPVLKDNRFIENVRKLGEKMKPLVQRNLAADIWIVCVWDQPNGMRFANAEEASTYGLSADELLDRAVQNYLATRPAPEITSHGSLQVAQTNDCYDASLLLDQNWWTENTGKMRGDTLACIPARHVVLFADSATAGVTRQMRQVAEKMEASGDHLITGTILVRRNGAWEEYHEPQRPPTSPPRPPATRTKPFWKFW